MTAKQRGFAAILGATILAGSSLPPGEVSGIKPAPNHRPSAHTSSVPPFRAYANWRSPDCYRAPSHDVADLCAQYRAAQAADESAWWAAFSGWFGGLSFLGVLVAIGISLHSNYIARDTARRQLRAYISFESVQLRRKDGALDRVSFTWQNTGQTPAIDVVFEAAVSVLPVLSDEAPEGRALSEPSKGSLGAGRPMTAILPLDQHKADVLSSALAGTAQAIFAYGAIRYRDIFNEHHALNFRLYLTKEFDDADPGHFHISDRGNFEA